MTDRDKYSMRLLFFCALLAASSDLFSQCPGADFLVNDNACLRENLSVSNMTAEGALAYKWDFCAGDLATTASVHTALTHSDFYRARSLRFVQDGGNWYAFAISATGNNLMRLDFGTDLRGTPVFNNLGNVGGYLSGSFGFDLILHEGVWHLFAVNGGSKRVVRISFSDGLQNPPSAHLLETPGIFDDTTPNFVRMVEDKSSLYAFVAAGTSLTDSKIVRLDMGASALTLTPGLSTFNVPGSSQLRGMAFVKECGEWIALALSTNTNSMYRLAFSGGLQQPPETALVSTGLTLNTPVNIETVREGGIAYALVQNSRIEESNAALYRINFGSSFANVVQQTDKLQWPQLTGGAYALAVVEDSSSWHSFTVNLADKKLLRMDFSSPCFASTPVSTLETPPRFHYAMPGSYCIALEIMDAEGNVSSESDTVLVSALESPVSDFSSDNMCALHDVNFTLLNTAGDVGTYHWDFGDGGTSEVLNPVHQFAEGGSYNVRLEILAANGCRNFVERPVEIFPEPLADFLLPAGPICTNGEFTFANLVADVYAGHLSYQWYVDDVSVSTERDLRQTFGGTGVREIKLRTMIPGCATEVIKTTAPLEAGPVVDFSFEGDCEGEVFTFHSAVTDPVTSVHWDFGTGDIASGSDVEHAYSTFGEYAVTLTAMNSAGCENRATRNVVVGARPVIDFHAGGPPNTCAGSTTVFTNLTVVPDGGDVTEWLWYFDGNHASGELQPGHLFAGAGSHTVSLRASTAAGCTSTVEKDIEIYMSPSAAFEPATACVDAPVEFSSLQSMPIVDWYWEIGTSYYRVPSPVHTFRGAGDYPVLVEMTAANGCKSSVERVLHVPEPAVPDFSIGRNCAGQQAVLTDITVSADPVVATRWLLDGAEHQGSPMTHTFEFTGLQHISLEVTTAGGCAYSVGREVEIATAPEAGFSTDTYSGGWPLEVSLTNTSMRATRFLWEFLDGTGATSAEPSPVYVFGSPGSFEIRLTASDARGCEDISSATFSVEDPRPDAALEMLSLLPAAGGGFKVIVTVNNKGNTFLEGLPLTIDFGGGLSLRKTIEERIAPATRYNYVFAAELLEPGDLTYLCASLDLSGDIDEVSNRICQELVGKMTLFPVWPNPVATLLTVEYIASGASRGRISIIDVSGRQVFSDPVAIRPGYNHHKIDLAGLEDGIYLLRIDGDDGVAGQRIQILR